MLGTSFQSSYPQSFAEFIWQSFLFYTKDRCQRCMDSVSSMPWVPFFSIYYIQPGGCSSITCPLFWGVSWNFIEKMRWELAFINKLSQFCHITSHHWAPQAKKKSEVMLRWISKAKSARKCVLELKKPINILVPHFQNRTAKVGDQENEIRKSGGPKQKWGTKKWVTKKKIAKKWVTR